MTDIQAKPSLRWVTLDLNDANTFPEKRKWVFWDRGEEPPVWGCYDTNNKFHDLVMLESSGEEEAEPLESGWRWLLETEPEKREEQPPISTCIDADAPYEDMSEEFKKGFDFCLGMVKYFETRDLNEYGKSDF